MSRKIDLLQPAVKNAVIYLVSGSKESKVTAI